MEDERKDVCPYCGNKCIPLQKINLKNTEDQHLKSVVISGCLECKLVSITREERE